MSSTDNWRTVWERKGAEARDVTADLERLLQADGFDTGYGGIAPAAWTTHVDRVLDRLGANAEQTVYEVGCGAGAFLLPIRACGLAVAGCDYSSTLIATAARAIPDGHFECLEANKVPRSPQYDFVVASSVFQYFPDLEYAQSVITAMARKARHGLAILDIPDIAHKQANLNLRYQVAGSKEAYEKRYKGFDHHFYDREWMAKTIQNAVAGSIDVSDQEIQDYANAPARFNVFARRLPTSGVGRHISG